MIARNKNEIVRKTLQFWLYFVLLLCCSLICVYFFVWAGRQRKSIYVASIQEHRSLVNKQMQLQDQVDSLYRYLTYIDFDKVDNYLFLEKYVIEKKEMIARQIGEDSTGKFITYANILSRLNMQVLLKDSIIKNRMREDILKKDLQNCMSRNNSVRNSIFRNSQIVN